MTSAVAAPHARIGIDVRMADSAGIGTYLRQLVPLVVDARPTWRFTLFGDTRTAAGLGWLGRANVESRQMAAPIYSLREQVALWPAGRGALDAFWSPHYNIPVAATTPLLVTIHDVIHLARPEYTRNPAKLAYARTMFEMVRRRAAAIMTVSDFTRREFLRLVGDTRAPMTVTPNGVARDWFGVHTGIPSAPRDGRPYVLAVASMKPHKNLPALIEAFALIRGDVPHDLLIVGRQDWLRTQDNRVRAMAEQLGERVRLAGVVSDADLHALVAGATVFVHPSLYEGFGLPPVEAMAAGCPCIVARTASMPEVCEDAALYCDPLDPTDIAARLYELLTDGALRAQLSARGRHQASKFDWRRTADAVVAQFDRLLS